MNIKVLGPGCASCVSMARVVKEVLIENKINATFEKVEDLQEIMKYNTVNTPVLVIDEKVTIKGKVPTKKEVLNVLTA